MIICSKRMPQGQGLAKVLVQRAPSITLDWDTRQKSRFDATDSTGRALGVFLPRGTVVRGGDVLVAEDGSLVRVEAAPQAVLRITACAEHGSAFDLTRAAYHLGNRHVPIELQPDHLKIEPDHVLADMLRAMHMTVAEVSEPFEPESGAYGDHGGHHHGNAHDAAHARSHDHAHSHDHGHSHDHTPATGKRIAIPVRAAETTPHVHGPHCNHGH
jgi:urease accessory protein